MHRAGAGAAPAAYATGPAVLGHKAALLVIEAQLNARLARAAEILAAGHQGVTGEQTGVPGARTLAGARAQLHIVVHVVAIAGGADHAACLLYTSDAADEEDSVDLGGR